MNNDFLTQSYVNNYADYIRELKLSKDMFGISSDRLGMDRRLITMEFRTLRLFNRY